jgi:hypothetical protein
MSHKIGTTLTATGEIWNVEDYTHKTDRRIEINLSEIYTTLIQEAGRWCESFASDLLHDIDNVKFALAHPYDWEKCRYFKKADNGNDSVFFRFGFRANGVDHKEYIEYAMKNEHEKYHYYRSIWELTIEKDATRNDRITATLKRVA